MLLNPFFGKFGGQFVPELLIPALDQLEKAFVETKDDPSFQAELNGLLTTYAGRPTPITLCRNLTKGTKAKLYLKREDLVHGGAHKTNQVLGQALLAKRMGKTRIIAETGAGQHGVATATVCALMDMECIVYMGATDIARQRPNVEKMEMLGATVVPVESGNMTLKDATNEAIRDWCCNPRDTYYIIGSTVGPHPYPDMVARFQSVISQEIRKQLLEKEGREEPDCIIACVGGGSNAAGAFYHFINSPSVRLIAAEAGGEGILSGRSAATIQLGREGIIHGARTLVMQTEDGQITEPYSISAGLDYPGIGPMHAFLSEEGREEVIAVDDNEALEAAYMLTRTEGIIPALESAHALAVLEKKKFAPSDVVVVNVSGRGDKDMEAYIRERKNAENAK